MLTTEAITALPLHSASAWQPGYPAPAVDAWRAQALAFAADPESAGGEAALAEVIAGAVSLPSTIALSGARYRTADVDALLDLIADALPEPEWPEGSRPE